MCLQRTNHFYNQLSSIIRMFATHNPPLRSVSSIPVCFQQTNRSYGQLSSITRVFATKHTDSQFLHYSCVCNLQTIPMASYPLLPMCLQLTNHPTISYPLLSVYLQHTNLSYSQFLHYPCICNTQIIPMVSSFVTRVFATHKPFLWSVPPLSVCFEHTNHSYGQLLSSITRVFATHTPFLRSVIILHYPCVCNTQTILTVSYYPPLSMCLQYTNHSNGQLLSSIIRVFAIHKPFLRSVIFLYYPCVCNAQTIPTVGSVIILYYPCVCNTLTIPTISYYPPLPVCLQHANHSYGKSSSKQSSPEQSTRPITKDILTINTDHRYAALNASGLCCACIRRRKEGIAQNKKNLFDQFIFKVTSPCMFNVYNYVRSYNCIKQKSFLQISFYIRSQSTFNEYDYFSSYCGNLTSKITKK